jgi:hypothetical protein
MKPRTGNSRPRPVEFDTVVVLRHRRIEALHDD